MKNFISGHLPVKTGNRTVSMETSLVHHFSGLVSAIIQCDREGLQFEYLFPFLYLRANGGVRVVPFHFENDVFLQNFKPVHVKTIVHHNHVSSKFDFS